MHSRLSLVSRIFDETLLETTTRSLRRLTCERGGACPFERRDEALTVKWSSRNLKTKTGEDFQSRVRVRS